MDVNLVLFKKSGSKKSFSLSGDITVIGRRHDCDFYIPLKQVSRRHCQLILNDGTVTIRDMGSKHGTYVNGDAVEEKDLVAGDYIHIPPVTLLVQIDGQPSRIVPPTPAEERPRAKKAAPKQKPEQEKTPPQPDLEDDSFPDLDAEASDSFLDDLKDL
jgi:pSer/pThr/pTyr-binding forkhead associated (FHA) protein